MTEPVKDATAHAPTPPAPASSGGRRRVWVPTAVLLVLAAVAVVEGVRVATEESILPNSGQAGWYLVILGVALAVTAGFAHRGAGKDAAPQEDATLPATDEATDQRPAHDTDPNSEVSLPGPPDAAGAEPVTAAPTAPAASTTADRREAPAGRARILLVLGLMTGWVLAFPWIGFPLTNGLFALAFLRWVSRYGWLRSLVIAAVIDVAAVGFFSVAGVVLPQGVLLRELGW